MKITKVEPIILQTKKTTPERHIGTTNLPDEGLLDDLVVRVETDSGIEGIGECDGHPIAVSALIRKGSFVQWTGFEEVLLGEDPLNVEYLWEKMYLASEINGRRGLGIWAMSGIDIALWDIVGKYYNQPVYKLLGGAGGKDAVVPYASHNHFATTKEELTDDFVAENLKSVKDAGFRAIKFHCYRRGLRDGSMLNMIRVAREVLGEKTAIMFDAYMGFETTEAIRFAKELEKYNVYFLEAALQPDNFDGYAKLSGSTSVKIAAGEEHTTRFMLTELMDKGKVDIVQADATEAGGITECRRIANLAHDRGKLYLPHCWKTNVSFAANLSLVASSVNSPFMEYPLMPGRIRRELTNEAFTMDSDGTIKLPERPGLGVTLNQKALDEFRYDVPRF
ncbi:MAG: mandelate racemase/muconate lactonizing enzyme family protein [Thaumarchaeota archaeon]|nr:mandelate racemase/muconate lactonizing enzyme family protein [Nitrososphaerota archaeon]